MMSGKVVGISFYVREKLPVELMSIAMRKGLDCGPMDIVAVKTVFVGYSYNREGDRIPGSVMTYEFDVIGTSSEGTPTPKGIQNYMAKLALEDGTDINEALRKAFG